MSLSKKIIIGAIIALLILWGIEALIVGHFMDQFANQKSGI